MSREKQFLQLHLQNAIGTILGASLKVVCGGAEWRRKKGVLITSCTGNCTKTNGMDNFVDDVWNESGVREIT